MKGLTISAHGGLDQLELRDDLPMPQVQRPTDVRVRMRAAALNHLDLFVVGGLPGVTIAAPWVLGADGTGVVDEIGDDVHHVAVGDTVVINPGISDRTCEYCRAGEQSLCIRFGILGEHHPGTMAEYVIVPAMNVRVIPATIPADIAAAFSLATLTAWRMVVTRARVKKPDNVLIWGIGGGVALAALEIVRLIGAKTWVTSHSDEKLALARGLGDDQSSHERRHESPSCTNGKARRGRRNRRRGSGDLEAIAARPWAAWTSRDLWSDVRTNGRDRHPPTILESVDNHGIDDGQRCRVRCRRRATAGGSPLSSCGPCVSARRGPIRFRKAGKIGAIWESGDRDR